MAVKTLVKRRRMITKKKKSPAQRLLELSQKREHEKLVRLSHLMEPESYKSKTGVFTPGFKIPKLSQVAKQAKAKLRHQRKRALKGSKDIIAGAKIDSSWISELTYDIENEKVHTIFEGRKYTFYNVPETLFNAWYAGAAATTTADKKRRWNLHDYPSLGAFFNQRIKNKYKHSRGWM